MDLNIIQIVFKICTDDVQILLPLLYDAVGRFENSFKKVGCMQRGIPCHLCKEQVEVCPYLSVFGQYLSTDPDVVRRHQKPSLPFVFKISELDSDSSSVDLYVVIVGNAIQHFSIFRDAILLMIASVAECNGMNVDVSGTWCLDCQGERQEFKASSPDLILLSGLEILRSSHNSDAVKIYLESPLKLVYRGSITHTFDFGTLFRSQLRRCSSLFAYYGEGELELDYVFMSEAAEKVIHLINQFNFTKPHWAGQGGSNGILGAGEFTGLAEGMLPMLKLGSYLNAGKGAAYGMGVYRIEGV